MLNEEVVYCMHEKALHDFTWYDMRAERGDLPESERARCMIKSAECVGAMIALAEVLRIDNAPFLNTVGFSKTYIRLEP